MTLTVHYFRATVINTTAKTTTHRRESGKEKPELKIISTRQVPNHILQRTEKPLIMRALLRSSRLSATALALVKYGGGKYDSTRKGSFYSSFDTARLLNT